MYLLMSETDGAAVLCGAFFFLFCLPKPFIRAFLIKAAYLVLLGLVAGLSSPCAGLAFSTLSQSMLCQMRGRTVCSRGRPVCWQEDAIGSTCALVLLPIVCLECVAWLGALRRALGEPQVDLP